MAASAERRLAEDANSVQKLEVSRVSGPDGRLVQSEGGDWRLSLRAVRLHNSHLQSGRRSSKGCPICGAAGLEGALAPVEEERAADSKDEVAAGDGSDEKGDAASSPGSWADQWDGP